MQTFRSPDRFVAGVRSDEDRARLAAVLERFGSPIEWMGVESAEMTKHALNAFLATSVAFINEVAAICEAVGADASDVARGLKSEERIGPRAYLAPGDAFAGGTLARDIRFLSRLARDQDLPAEVVEGVAASNAEHRNWSRRALIRLFGASSGNGQARPRRSADRRLGLDLQAGDEHVAALLGPRAVPLAGRRASLGAGLRPGDQRAARRRAGRDRARGAVPSPRFRAPTRWWCAHPGRSFARSPPTRSPAR